MVALSDRSPVENLAPSTDKQASTTSGCSPVEDPETRSPDAPVSVYIESENPAPSVDNTFLSQQESKGDVAMPVSIVQTMVIIS